MIEDETVRELLAARDRGESCALVTLVAARGSVPRAPGAKMIVYAADNEIAGTIGGGKFEALVIDEARELLAARAVEPLLKTYPLHEGAADSFGAVCGGEATVLIEPPGRAESLFIVGGGHCSRALARLARSLGWQVTVIEDRADLLAGAEAHARVTSMPAPEFIAGRAWQANEALVLVSRNVDLDREALYAALLGAGGIGYVGMMGSRRKVRLVFDELRGRGIPEEALERVCAPLGFDVGADTPAEIAISILAQVMQALRGRTGGRMSVLQSHGTPVSPPVVDEESGFMLPIQPG